MKNQYADTILEIDLSAIASNYRALCKKSGSKTVAAVVKANAYGLGIEPVAKTLFDAGCRKFFVANIDEALAFRSAINDAEIFVFNGISPEQYDVFLKHNITAIINNIDQFNLINKQKFNIGYALHVDTGMNRLGLSVNEFDELIASGAFKDIPKPEFIMSHMACADDKNHALNQQQISRFAKISEQLPDVPKSLANSHSVFNLENAEHDIIRAGVCLYGGIYGTKEGLKQTVSLKSRILQIREIDSTQTVGYGATYRMGEGGVIAILPLGYADGYSRVCSNKAFCYLNGTETPVIGAVSMDLLAINITSVDAKVGDYVELLGENISLTRLAGWANTIEYEILTNLGSRYKRVYKS